MRNKEAIRENFYSYFKSMNGEFENEWEKEGTQDTFENNRVITATSRKGEGGRKNPTQKRLDTKKILHR